MMMKAKRVFTDDELIQKLRDFVKKDGDTPRYRGSYPDLPSSSTYKKRFGSWNNALMKAGIEGICIKRKKPKRWEDEELLQWVKDFSNDNGRVPTHRDLDQDINAPSPVTLQLHFGSLTACFDRAGISTKRKLTIRERRKGTSLISKILGWWRRLWKRD